MWRKTIIITRKHVWYSGLVQGVGFRFTARRLAGTCAVTGVVKNLSDGRVELIVEGEAEQVERYLALLEQEMHGYIESQEAVDEEARGDMSGFEVTF